MNMSIDDIKIEITIAKAKSEMLAFVKVGFPLEVNGEPVLLTISGFRIMTNHYQNQRQGSYRLIEPMILRPGKKPLSIFRLHDKPLWFKLQSRILAEYEKLAAREIFNQPEENETS